MSLIRYGIALYLILSGLCLNSAQAEENDLWDRPLEDLLDMKVVSGTRKENSLLRLPMVVTVLSEHELRRWGADNLADGLRAAAGVQIGKGPGDFPQYKTAIRGNTADFMNVRTLFLIDGVAVRNPNAGFDPGWIPLSIVKRVEIVKGPASGIYGANAFGGLINVITHSGQDSESLAVEGSMGVKTHKDVTDGKEVLGSSANFSVGDQKEGWDYFASTQYSGAQNTEKTAAGLQEQDVFAKIRHQVSENVSFSLRSLLSLDRNQLALLNADSPMKNDFLHVAGTMKYKLAEKTDLDITGHLSTFDHFVKYNDALIEYENKAQMYGLNVQLATTLQENHVLTNGLEYSEVSGKLQTNAFDYSAFPPNVVSAGWESEKNSSYGVYSQYEYLGWESYMPLVGIRYDQDSAFGGALSPRLGLSYLYKDQITLYSSVGRGFRAPIFNETHIQGYGKVGNPRLNPEYTTIYEVGAKSVYESSQNAVSVFKQDVTKQIILVPLDPSLPNGLKTFENSGTSSISGIEFEGSYKLDSLVRFFYNGAWLKSDDGSGKRVERLIERKAVFGMNLFFEKWKMDLALINEGDLFFFNTNTAIPSDSEGRVFLPEVTTLNVQAVYDMHDHQTMTLYVNNATDQKYKETFSSFVEQDGFWLPGRTIGLRWDGKF